MRKCIYCNTLESTFATRPHRDVYVKCRWIHLSLSFTFALSLKVTLLYNHFRRNTAPRPFGKFKHNVFKCTSKCRQFGMLKFKVSKRFALNDIFVWFSSLVGACFCVMHVEPTLNNIFRYVLLSHNPQLRVVLFVGTELCLVIKIIILIMKTYKLFKNIIATSFHCWSTFFSATRINLRSQINEF